MLSGVGNADDLRELNIPIGNKVDFSTLIPHGCSS